MIRKKSKDICSELEKRIPQNESSLLYQRLTKKPTEWLRQLPPGNYTVKELERLTGRVASTIKQRLNLLAIPRSYNATSGYPLVVYNWVGIVEYERQNRLKKVSERTHEA